MATAALSHAARTRRLLEGPVAPTLLRLAAPNVVVLVVQVAINTLEAFFVGWLGSEAIAGVSVAFPVIMLMQTMSAGGMGGGVASAVARALGAGRRDDADALVLHALLIGFALGGAFTAGVLAGGPALYRAMGAEGGTLAAALAYSNVIFAGAVIVWLFNTLASVVRGTGNMLLPAAVVLGGAPVVATLSPALIFGWGPFPRLGVAGAATAFLTFYALGASVFLAYLLSGRSLATLRLSRVRLRWALFREILRVGAPGIVNTVQTNLTVVLLTGLVGAFGTPALAGYGMGVRLEYMMIPLVFGLGAALVTMVGTNYGAGERARAKRVAWVGAATAAGITETIGLLAALFPRVWIGLFSSEPDVIAAGSAYLRIVGPSYGFFGLGLALYFASQGAGRLLWPILAGLARLVVATAGGFAALHWFGGGLTSLFAVMALALTLFGITIAIAVAGGAWRVRRN
ncbi:MAG: MATE family efflux transporter [Candidatus Rokubacteria bacterium 13_2_20CM_69_15_1]|nr:MAG: MATE family efflux transporter [Candidatus Rokubacteria bacterium 13_2_20CM_69_15_1]